MNISCAEVEGKSCVRFSMELEKLYNGSLWEIIDGFTLVV